MPYLEFLKGLASPPVAIAGSPFRIGRASSCDLVLDDVTVSREHARIEKDGETRILVDCGSRHGTSLNGVPLDGSAPLTDEDVIGLCGYVFKFFEGTKAVCVEEDSESEPTVIVSTKDAVKDTDDISDVDARLKLKAVVEILRCVQDALEEDDLLDRTLERLFSIFPHAVQGAILVPGEDGELEAKASRDLVGVTGGEVRVSKTIVRQAIEKKQAILSADALSDDHFEVSHSISRFGIRSIMCVPLLGQDEEPIAVLQMHGEDRDRRFSNEDLEILVSVASTLALALENLRLHENLLRQEKLQRELELARDVQRRFLPELAPEITGYSFSARYQAADSVGGDYYGLIELPGDRMAIAIGDVSGKGMPAAMLMARLSSDVRYAVLTSDDPGKALQVVGQSLGEAEIGDKFVTLLLCVLDLDRHTLTLANAGHIPPLLRHADGKVEEVANDVAGYPINVALDPDYSYDSTTITLEPGDALLTVTDGVLDATNPERELYGPERVRECFEGADGAAQEIVERLLGDVEEFTAGTPRRDDTTVMCFRREG